jgi:hypothetical protein
MYYHDTKMRRLPQSDHSCFPPGTWSDDLLGNWHQDVIVVLHRALLCLYEAASVLGIALATLDLFLACHGRLQSGAAQTVSMKTVSFVSVVAEKARGVREAGKSMLDVALRRADVVGETLCNRRVIELM